VRALLQVLLKHKGGDSLLDDNDRYGFQPLHIAAQKGYLDVVKVRQYRDIIWEKWG